MISLLLSAALVTSTLEGGAPQCPAWRLTPEAVSLLKAWGEKPYVRKNGRTDFFVRAQLKYGVNRDDFIHHWYDRPLLQDSSLGQRRDEPNETKTWLNPDAWRLTVEMGRLGKQEGFAVFTCTKNRDEVIPFSVSPGSETTILVELTRGLTLDECVFRAEQALKMPNSYRIGGKVVLTSYPAIRERDLTHYAELKKRLTEKFGDKFLLMPYFNLFGDDRNASGFDVARLERTRARLARALEVLDGLCYNGRESYYNRRYDPWLFDHVITPIVRSVLAEPRFKDKALGCWSTPGHENSYRWNYGLDSTGTHMLRETLASLVKLGPDFMIGCEWDEENENTCFRPTVANGFTHQRLLRYFHDLANGCPPDVFPGDDTAIPNLVLSYRKELMAGEPLEVEVLNIPDGTFDGADIDVSFAWKTPEGKAVRTFPAQQLCGGKLEAAWFTENVSALVSNPALVPELTIRAKGRTHVVSDGCWPVGLRPSRCIEYKWVKQCVRELPQGVSGGLSVSAPDAEGVRKISGMIEGARRFRSIAVLDETDTVYMFDGRAFRDEDVVRVRLAFQGEILNEKNTAMKGSITLVGAPGAKLRIDRSRGHIAVKDQDFVFSGAMVNNWPHYLFADVPNAEAPTARFVVKLPGFFEGEIAVADLLRKEIEAISGPQGSNLVFTRYLSQERIPPPQMVRSATFAFRWKPGLPNSLLRMEAVDEDFHVWRSKPFSLETPSGQTVKFSVFERDSGAVNEVRVDASRTLRTEYVFEPARGSVVATVGGRNLRGILGGCVPLVTGFGQGESGYGNSAQLALRKTTPNWQKSAPDYVREPDGAWALKFSGCSYVSLPQQLWPVHAGFELTLVVNPDDVVRRQGLVFTGGTSGGLYLENGRVKAWFFLRNRFMKISGRAARVEIEGPEISTGKWQTVRLVCDQRTARIEVDDVIGEPVPVSGDLFYPLYTALGAGLKDTEYFAGRMKSFSVKLK